MQILEVNKYRYVTEYKIKTDKGIFMHSVTNETSHFVAKEEIRNNTRKRER